MVQVAFVPPARHESVGCNLRTANAMKFNYDAGKQ
jgi:hypothetical protein